MSEDLAPEPARPLLRVVRGTPTPDELAALLAVLAARSGAAVAPEPAPPSRWADRSRTLRGPLPTGPGAWRASALPS